MALMHRVGVWLAILSLALGVTPALAQDVAAWTVLDLVNQARIRAGAGPLTLNGALIAAAQRHSNDMAAGGFLDHTGSDGSTAGQRISEAGYAWTTVGENAGQTWAVDPAAIVDLWLNSAGHRDNLLNPAFIDLGLAYAVAGNGAVYWTLTLGAQPGAVPPAPQVAPTPVPPTAIPPTPAPPPTAAPLIIASPLPTATPLRPPTLPPTATALPSATPLPGSPAVPTAAAVSAPVIALIEAPGIPWTLWFQRLPAGYRPVNAQGIALLPEDGIPPELWFQIPPELP